MKLKIFSLVLLLPILSFAIIVEVQAPLISSKQFQNDLPQTITQGEPMMPYIPVKILLPMGHQLRRIEVKLNNFAELEGDHKIDHARKVQPISQQRIDNTKPNLAIYNSETAYPEKDYELVGTQSYRGYTFAILNLYPYKYFPKLAKISWAEHVIINFKSDFKQDIFDEQNTLLRIDEQTKKVLTRTVINHERINSYQKNYLPANRTLVDPSEPYDMIIITDTDSEPHFDDFISWKQDHGIAARTFNTSDIFSEYGGINPQEQIKNFIIDAYTVYSGTDTPLEYVILGGDDEIIPIRTIYISSGGSTIDNAMPSDLYYACLDDMWDDNGNGVYGEVEDNCDIIPEITVARFPAETETEFSNIINKTISYVEEPNVSNDVAYMVGENLNWDPVTWGGDYKDEIVSLTPSLDTDYHLFTLYDRDGTYSPLNVKAAINNGTNIINHMGHSNEGIVFGQTSGHVNSYTNTEYGFAYSQGCYPAAFDEVTSHEGEAIAENLVKSPHGLLAFIGNTRYGWYMPGSTNGPSQPYDIEYFDAIFNQDIRELGKALDESRIVLANTALAYSCARWVHMELVLFGDPSVAVHYPNGGFPYIQPVQATYDDEIGDGDGIPNPGEEIEIFIELENLEGWENAVNVSAEIEFLDDAIQVINSQVNYGNINSGASIIADPFHIIVPQDCNYESYQYLVHISAPVTNEILFERTYEMNMDVSLNQQYWPWFTNNSILSNPIISDFDQDGNKDIIIVDATSNVNVMQIDTQQVAGFPLAGEHNIWKSTALGDINNDGADEIVIADRSGKIRALDFTGNEVINNSECCEQLLTPVLADVNGNGNLEIISFGLDKYLNVIDNEGQMLDNFPLEMSMLSIYEIAAADLDQDGKSEIIFSTLDGNLFAINQLAENAAGFPTQLSSLASSAPIILDNRRIAIGTNDEQIHLFSAEGELLFSKELTGKLVTAPIAADFDDDEDLDIAFSTMNGDLYVIDQNGNELPGWPISINKSVTNPPLAVDLNDDGNLNFVLMTASNDLYVYHNDGTEVDFAPVPINMIGNTPSSIEDIDNDGDFDIISGLSTGAIIIDSKLPKGNRTPWKTYRGNYHRTGFYGDNDLTGAQDIIPDVGKTMLNQNFPNPFNPTTTINFDLADDIQKAEIQIYNIKGQRIKNFSLQNISQKKNYNVVWNGRDEQNRLVGSGVYFYQLKADENVVDVKKCLLIK